MPPFISVFLDTSSAAADAAARAELRWRELARNDGFEVVAPPRDRPRAAQLTAALAQSRAPHFAWLDATFDPDPETLRALVAALGSAGAASALVQGIGGALEPADGSLTRTGARVARAGSDQARRVLFAAGGAAVYDRAALVGAGGFARDYVIGHEDADAGWRLALGGRESIVVPGVTFRRVAEAAPRDRLTRARYLRHASANELKTLITCAPDEWFRPALCAALARQLALAGEAAGIDPNAIAFGATALERFHMPVEAVARLLAIEDVVCSAGTLLERRRALQAAASPLATLETLFADPPDADWLAAAGDGARALCDALGLGRIPRSRGTTNQNPPPEHTRGAADSCPTVSIVVLTAVGATHLPACLDSISRLNYPRSLLDVVVVDNASREDPTAVVARHYDGARVLRQTRNLGFCGGNAVGFAAARGDWVLFLNDDTRVDAELVNALLDTARRREASCVGAFITNWAGDKVDFAGGGINFEARGFQLATGAPDVERWRAERPAAFACGAAMLVERHAFSQAGGFPEEYFAYYEDVALGWALWLLGHDVWISKDAVVRHLHHGTSSLSANAARVRHCERNALYTLFTHATDDALPDLLSAALVLATERVLIGIGLGIAVEDDLSLESAKRMPLARRASPRLAWNQFRAAVVERGGGRAHGALGTLRRIGLSGIAASGRAVVRQVVHGGAPGRIRQASERYEMRGEHAAIAAALFEWGRTLPALARRREMLQQSRTRSEHDIVTAFPDHWLDPIPVEPTRQPEYNTVHRAVIEMFGLRRFLPRA